MTGTSPAAAVVTGLVALILAKENAGNLNFGDRLYRAIPDVETLKVALQDRYSIFRSAPASMSSEGAGGFLVPNAAAELATLAIFSTDPTTEEADSALPRPVSRSRWERSSHRMFLHLQDGGVFPLLSFTSKAEASTAVGTALNVCIEASALEPLRDVLGVVDEREWRFSADRFQWWLASGGRRKLEVRGNSVVESERAATTRRFRGASSQRFATVLFESE